MASMPALQAVPSASVPTPARSPRRGRLDLVTDRARVAPRSAPVVTGGERRGALIGVVLAHAAGILLLAQAAFTPAPMPPETITAVLIELPKPMPVVAPPAPPKRPPEKVQPRQKPAAPVKPTLQPPHEPSLPPTASPSALSALAPAPAEPRPAVEARPAQPVETPAPAKPAPPPAPTPARFDAAYLNNPAPAYPPLSRRMREEGKVLLRVQVTAEGLPAKVDLAESSGFGRLDQAARDAVQRWRFVPAKQDGHAVDAAVVVPIIFKLEGN